MSSKIELLCNQLSENQIIQGWRGVQPINDDIDIEVDEQLVNNDKMASYSQVMSGNIRVVKQGNVCANVYV